MKQQKDLLTVAKCAAVFGVSQVSIYQMVINNSIPHIKIDRIPYFSEQRIRSWQKKLMATYRI